MKGKIKLEKNKCHVCGNNHGTHKTQILISTWDKRIKVKEDGFWHKTSPYFTFDFRSRPINLPIDWGMCDDCYTKVATWMNTKKEGTSATYCARCGKEYSLDEEDSGHIYFDNTESLICLECIKNFQVFYKNNFLKKDYKKYLLSKNIQLGKLISLGDLHGTHNQFIDRIRGEYK